MSYLDAPGTALLATHCAACGRPLLDAASVELGIGPVCREGAYPEGLSEEAHAEANRLVHTVALDPLKVADAAPRLLALGLPVLAERLLRRAGVIEIQEEGVRLVVLSPFNAQFVACVKVIPGRRWDKERKAWSVPAKARAQLWRFLRDCYQGHGLKSSKGFTIIGGM